MANIKFLDRVEETEKIREMQKENFFLVVKGRRRIGKTALLLKALPNAAYIFVWPNKSQTWITEKVCEELSLPGFKSFVDVVKYLMENKRVLILDEFQNFLKVDKSVYGELQRLIDERMLGKKFVKIAVAGSSYSMINKVFMNSASPLYGRHTHEIQLEALPIKDLYDGLGFSFEEFIKLWAVFGGVPYYFKLVDSKLSAEESIKEIIISRSAQLQNEGRVVLSVEFGGDFKTYGTVLSAIAESKTRLGEISAFFDGKTGEASKYLDILRKEFGLVKRITPLLSDPKKSKDGRYEIIDNFLGFWFCFIDKHRDYFEQERFAEVEGFFDKNFNAFLGKKFEKFCLESIKARPELLPFKPDKIGGQWGKIREKPKGKNTYEIDIIALNEKTREILFAECKWKNKANPGKILRELKEKSQHVQWNNGKRKEFFAVFAKSFSKKTKEKNARCIDLKEIEKTLLQK